MKKKKLLNELMYFYGVINTNVQIANVAQVQNKDKIFRDIITILNRTVSEIIFKEFKVSKIQKILERDSRLKNAWSKTKIPTPKPIEKAEKDYFS